MNRGRGGPRRPAPRQVVNKAAAPPPVIVSLGSDSSSAAATKAAAQTTPAFAWGKSAPSSNAPSPSVEPAAAVGTSKPNANWAKASDRGIDAWDKPRVVASAPSPADVTASLQAVQASRPLFARVVDTPAAVAPSSSPAMPTPSPILPGTKLVTLGTLPPSASPPPPVVEEPEPEPAPRYQRRPGPEDSANWRTASRADGTGRSDNRASWFGRDKSERTGDRGERAGDRGERASDRGERAGDRGERAGDRGERASDRGERAGDRGERAGDRGERAGDRGERAGDRGERTGDRGERTGDRGDRIDRGDRNDRDRNDWGGDRDRSRDASRDAPDRDRTRDRHDRELSRERGDRAKPGYERRDRDRVEREYRNDWDEQDRDRDRRYDSRDRDREYARDRVPRSQADRDVDRPRERSRDVDRDRRDRDYADADRDARGRNAGREYERDRDTRPVRDGRDSEREASAGRSWDHDRPREAAAAAAARSGAPFERDRSRDGADTRRAEVPRGVTARDEDASRRFDRPRPRPSEESSAAPAVRPAERSVNRTRGRDEGDLSWRDSRNTDSAERHRDASPDRGHSTRDSASRRRDDGPSGFVQSAHRGARGTDAEAPDSRGESTSDRTHRRGPASEDRASAAVDAAPAKGSSAGTFRPPPGLSRPAESTAAAPATSMGTARGAPSTSSGVPVALPVGLLPMATNQWGAGAHDELSSGFLRSSEASALGGHRYDRAWVDADVVGDAALIDGDVAPAPGRKPSIPFDPAAVEVADADQHTGIVESIDGANGAISWERESGPQRVLFHVQEVEGRPPLVGDRVRFTLEQLPFRRMFQPSPEVLRAVSVSVISSSSRWATAAPAPIESASFGAFGSESGEHHRTHAWAEGGGAAAGPASAHASGWAPSREVGCIVNLRQAYGFIRPLKQFSSADDRFFQLRDVKLPESWSGVRINDYVEYTLVPDRQRNKLRAVDLHVLDGLESVDAALQALGLVPREDAVVEDPVPEPIGGAASSKIVTWLRHLEHNPEFVPLHWKRLHSLVLDETLSPEVLTALCAMLVVVGDKSRALYNSLESVFQKVLRAMQQFITCSRFDTVPDAASHEQAARAALPVLNLAAVCRTLAERHPLHAQQVVGVVHQLLEIAQRCHFRKMHVEALQEVEDDCKNAATVLVPSGGVAADWRGGL